MKTVLQILQENKDHLRFSQIDRALDLSIGTTARVVRGDEYRNFSDEQEKIIREYLAKLGDKITC